MLKGETDNNLGYGRNSITGNNTGNSRNGKYTKTIQSVYGEATLSVLLDLEGNFDPIVVPKYQKRGSTIEKLMAEPSTRKPLYDFWMDGIIFNVKENGKVIIKRFISVLV